MADGKVVFQIDGDARGVKNTIKDVTSDIEKETKKWDNAVKESSDDMTKSFAKAFDIERLKNWGIQAAKAVGKFIGEAIYAASNLAEVQNVVDVTFGDSARQIDAWAKQAGASYGLTETQAKRYASTIGAMVKSQGIAQSEVLGMSESLAGLAADMASFYNLDFDTAFEKLRSGISGETEPLKQLGINMSVANLEAFALEQGITKSYTAMSQGEQTMLRYQYIMKATADAQGDFARTSDSMANATRRMTASIETIKTKVGQLLLPIIEPFTSAIAGFLENITATPQKTVLDDFAEIDKQYADQLNRIQASANIAEDILTVMDRIKTKTATLKNGQTISFEELFGQLDKVKSGGGDIREYISSLGLDVSYVAGEYDVWSESVSRLTSTVPALTSVIDEQTGSIIGGTDAIREQLREWKASEEQKVVLSAFYAKKQALASQQGELGALQLDMETARVRYERYTKSASATTKLLTGQAGLLLSVLSGGKAYTPESQFNEAENKYNTAVEAYGTAEEQLADAQQALINMYGETAVAAFEASGAVQGSAEDSEDSLRAYTESVRDLTQKTVDSIVSGFSVLERPTTDLLEKRSKLIEQQNELNRSTKDGEKRYQELQVQIDELNKSMDQYSPKGMQEGLESQLAFMDEYIKNLEKAQSMGLSGDLLSFLSDGSVQSAEYLAGLVANPEQAAAVDELYQKVQEKKKEFTDALVDQKTTLEGTYGEMVDTASSAVEEMNLEEAAYKSAFDTVQGLINGLSDQKNPLDLMIISLLSSFSRLSGDFHFGLPSFSGSLFSGSNKQAHIGEYAVGLDYVPFDGFLASLHEGESILTAEENRIWQRFKNGAQPQTMDYDALGATMRENVQAGGNVYLDGRAVGQVISQVQGNSYRSLQRSGFQA